MKANMPTARHQGKGRKMVVVVVVIMVT